MKKILWMMVSGLMALSLVMAACAPAATPATPATPAIPATPTTPIAPVVENPQKEAAKLAADVPKYGGVLSRGVPIDVRGWDQLLTPMHLTGTIPVGQSIVLGDWARGPAGTGEITDFGPSVWANYAGQLDESWEVFPSGRAVHHLRKGIHFAFNPNSEASRLVNGREFTAYDAEYSLNRQAKTPGAYQYGAIPQAAKDVKITALDKYTLEIDIYPSEAFSVNYFFCEYAFADTPREVITKYGNMGDWRNVVGTGPFMLTDYVSGSAITYTRNPNYFQKDPAGPGKGNQLPYLDGLQHLIIPDASTMQAAIRTGKLSVVDNQGYDDTQSLLKTAPKLNVAYTYIAYYAVFMRQDIKERPYSDKRVRQALMMATDFDAINKALYGGQGSIPGYPLPPDIPGLEKYALTLKEAPEAVKELYRYNPEKSKQLLKEAGFPNGFSADILVSGAGSAVDELAIIKAQWEKVGVKLNMQVKDSGTFVKIEGDRSHTDLIYSAIGGVNKLWPRGFGHLHDKVAFNKSFIEEEYIMTSLTQYNAAWLSGNEAERIRLSKYVIGRVIEDSFAIGMPGRRVATFWWPWVKNYYGVNVGGFQGFPHQYVWIDQNLKKSMGY